MFRLVIAASAILLTASPLLAWTSRDGFRVEPQGAGQFEVQARPGLSAAEAWCAAGSYAVQRLGLSQQDRIWRATAAPRRAGQGIGFSLSPEASTGKTGLLIVGEDNGSVSVAFAQQLCWGNRSIRE
ncbi:hypothetical protein [Gemmobacter serpentinus]|uniref:hypothetical protein n=1 Tax=Gemmobacter serpentinus TaxID=2652247 RepID=UPI00124E6F2D|nr:hypothetical protein [Gemmobacter serpentinus]